MAAYSTTEFANIYLRQGPSCTQLFAETAKWEFHDKNVQVRNRSVVRTEIKKKKGSAALIGTSELLKRLQQSKAMFIRGVNLHRHLAHGQMHCAPG